MERVHAKHKPKFTQTISAIESVGNSLDKGADYDHQSVTEI